MTWLPNVRCVACLGTVRAGPSDTDDYDWWCENEFCRNHSPKTATGDQDEPDWVVSPEVAACMSENIDVTHVLRTFRPTMAKVIARTLNAMWAGPAENVDVVFHGYATGYCTWQIGDGGYEIRRGAGQLSEVVPVIRRIAESMNSHSEKSDCQSSPEGA